MLRTECVDKVEQFGELCLRQLAGPHADRHEPAINAGHNARPAQRRHQDVLVILRRQPLSVPQELPAKVA
jgi:hypothetical protein